MEPHREQKALQPGAEQRPKRFRIIKLEERIAPKKGHHGRGSQTGDCTETVVFCCYQTTVW